METETVPVYTVILTEEHPEAWENLKKEWPEDSHIINGRQAFVVSHLLTSEIAEKIGIKSGSDGATGMVVQMDYYSGTGPPSAVEWLDKKRRQ